MDLKMIRVIGSKIMGQASKNAPTILTMLGVLGVPATALAMSKATNDARTIVEEEYEAMCADMSQQLVPPPPFTNKEKASMTWKCYIPVATTGLMTIACIVGANVIHLRREAALAGLYLLADGSLKEYKEKVVETIGEKKEAKIHEEIAQDRLNANPVTDSQVIHTGKGEVLCFDSLSSRYFLSDMETIRRIQNDFNHSLLSEGGVSLNELYSDLNLEPIALGHDIGWRSDYQMLNIAFTSKISTDGRPCMVLDFHLSPPRKL